MKKEKVYITRDEGDDFIWLWKKPTKGNWSPHKMEDCEIVVYQRDDIDNADYYLYTDFKKKFDITLPKKIKRCVHLPYDLIHNEDYKLISNDPNRKK